nr:brassinosteroid lrr receptor kinase brl2 [Quercus suber]
MLYVHLSPALGFILGAGVGDANNIRCLEGERQALLEFKKGLVDDSGKLSSWRSEEEHKNCCNWEGVHCDNQTGHVLELEVHDLREEFVDNARLMLKRREYKYGKILGLLKIIDLSSNKLMGKLPDEISSLLQLVGLNVSRNNLVGEIPQTIGQMKQLQSLDLSRNQFSGKIPSSMSELNFLSDIDLSCNNLSGKIPTSTQLQSFKASDFTGNPTLCGPPLIQKCPGEEVPNQSHQADYGNKDDEDEFGKWFYVGTGFGFAISFWGVCGSLLGNDDPFVVVSKVAYIAVLKAIRLTRKKLLLLVITSK